jgi:hypothetical protein
MSELAIVYSNRSQECDRVVALLQSLEHKFVEYVIGIDFTDKQFIDEFGPTAEFPQIAIGTKHIGSLKETLQHFNYNNQL